MLSFSKLWICMCECFIFGYICVCVYFNVYVWTTVFEYENVLRFQYISYQIWNFKPILDRKEVIHSYTGRAAWNAEPEYDVRSGSTDNKLSCCAWFETLTRGTAQPGPAWNRSRVELCRAKSGPYRARWYKWPTIYIHGHVCGRVPLIHTRFLFFLDSPKIYSSVGG